MSNIQTVNRKQNKKLKVEVGKSRLRSYKWLLLRRVTQLSILSVFLLGPLFGIWIIKGNMSSSVLFNTIHLTDPFVFLQTLAAGMMAENTLIIGAVTVAVLYFLLGGRVYCSWVCPINIVTDLADWLRRKLNIKSRLTLSRNNRNLILMAVLLAALFTGTLAWELINPVTLIQRELVFGMGLAWVFVLGIFILDLLISRRAWCGHLCPMGKFYSLLGEYSFIRVNAVQREHCNDCMDCYAVCPEPQVIKPALKGDAFSSPVILSGDCTNCGQCIDICAQDVFSLGPRFITKKSETSQSGVSS